MVIQVNIKLIKKRNKIFITVISSLILPLLTILISLYIFEKQNYIDREQTEPIFFMKKIDPFSSIDNIKIINKGGLVTYFQFTRKTRIDLFIKNKHMILDIGYNDKNRLSDISPNIENKRVWYYEPSLINFSIDEMEKRIRNSIDSKFKNNKDVSFSISDYYSLLYRNYKNELNTYYFSFDKNGIGQYYDYDENNLDNIYSIGGLSTMTIDNSEDLYNAVDDVIIDCIIRFRWQDEVSY